MNGKKEVVDFVPCETALFLRANMCCVFARTWLLTLRNDKDDFVCPKCGTLNIFKREVEYKIYGETFRVVEWQPNWCLFGAKNLG